MQENTRILLWWAARGKTIFECMPKFTVEHEEISYVLSRLTSQEMKELAYELEE